MSRKKTCFLICHFGKEQSDERKRADRLEKALKYGLADLDFQVVRGDRIGTTTAKTIVVEIIEHLESAELCIVDLAWTRSDEGGPIHNANVYYELGYRHCMQLPVIHLVPRGTLDSREPFRDLPFDLKNYRCVEYDLKEEDGCLRLGEDVERVVRSYDEQLQGDWKGKTTQDRLVNIEESLKKIEAKLSSRPVEGRSGSSSARRKPLGSFSSPRERFMAAVANGDMREAEEVLPALVDSLQDVETILGAAGILAAQGSQVGVQAIKKCLENRQASMTLEAWKAALGALTQFYHLTDRELEGIDEVCPLINNLCNGAYGFSLSARDKAWFVNQQQKLYYGASLLKKGEPNERSRYLNLALDGARQVVGTIPEEPAYHYNISLIYEQLGDNAKALEHVDEYMNLETHDGSHLNHAADLYLKTPGREDSARNALIKLKAHDPEKLSILSITSDYKEKIHELLGE